MQIHKHIIFILGNKNKKGLFSFEKTDLFFNYFFATRQLQ